MDSSWWLQWGDTSLIIDPWLIGSEVDGFKWLNEQWHAIPSVALSEIPAYKHILISQPYSDHCHSKTLLQLTNDATIYAVPPAQKRLIRELKKPIECLGAVEGEWTQVDSIKVMRLTPKKWLDPIYHALVLAHKDEAILYAPHGFKLRPDQLKMIEGLSIKLLITSFAYFRIPEIMGGLVNPGSAGAKELINQVKPEMVLNTHDEDKVARGLVIRLAKRIYPDMHQESLNDSSIKVLNDYSLMTV